MAEQYSVLPGYYDRLNTEADYDSYHRFIVKNIKEKCSVLDLGCGTGIMSVRLAEEGFDVTGLDASGEMLTVASKRAEKFRRNVFFTCQDMTTFKTVGKYDAVISLFDCMNYLLTDEKLLSAFQSVKRALCDDGVFIFDMNTKYKFENVYADRSYILEDNGVFCVWDNEYNPKTGKCKFYIDIFAEDKNGKYTRMSEVQTEKMYTDKKIESLLDKAGFELIYMSSGFDGQEICDNTERYYFIAKPKR